MPRNHSCNRCANIRQAHSKLRVQCQLQHFLRYHQSCSSFAIALPRLGLSFGSSPSSDAHTYWFKRETGLAQALGLASRASITAHCVFRVTVILEVLSDSLKKSHRSSAVPRIFLFATLQQSSNTNLLCFPLSAVFVVGLLVFLYIQPVGSPDIGSILNRLLLECLGWCFASSNHLAHSRCETQSDRPCNPHQAFLVPSDIANRPGSCRQKSLARSKAPTV